MKARFLTVVTILSLFFTHCTRYGEPSEEGAAGGYTEVTIAASTPSQNIITRAMSPADECTMKVVDILVFVKDGEQERFVYKTHNTNELDPFGGGSQYIRASMKISENGESYRIVLLANLRNELDEVLANNFCTGMTKEELLEKILVVQDGKWPAGTGDGLREIPMWGEAASLAVITKNTTPSDFGGEIKMVRSIARINIGVSITGRTGERANGTDIFDLAEVKVYNARKQGRAVSAAGNMNDGKAVLPTLVVGSELLAPSTMSYVLADIDPQHNNQLASTIYVNEAENRDREPTEATFLIIKGYYTEGGVRRTPPKQPITG